MNVRIHSVDLGGRKVNFREGLSVVLGPISTGKTSLLRLCRLALGGAVSSLPPEVLACGGVSALLDFDERELRVYREFGNGVGVFVDVVFGESVLHLPVNAGKSRALTYSQWALRALGLPSLEVPSAPTRPESDSTPVSINDYLLYCDLPKEEIRSSVFGHIHPFRDIKRRYVFEILYGQYDIETARIQDELRDLRHALLSARHEVSATTKFFGGTALENRASLEAQLIQEESRNADMRRMRESAHLEVVSRQPEVGELRRDIQRLDEELAVLRRQYGAESGDITRLRDLCAQLDTQVARVTRAIVAGELLLGIDFVVCPRCSSPVSAERAGATPHCYLCLQMPVLTPSRDDLIREQGQLAAQLEETRELLDSRLDRARFLEKSIDEASARRAIAGRELDELTRSFVSDSVASLERMSAEIAESGERMLRLADYLRLHEKYAAMRRSLASLQDSEALLLGRLEVAKVRRDDVEERILELEDCFTALLGELALPQFLGTPIGKIDRRTYLPSVNGRSFDELLSEGLSVEVNIAHALAHHVTALRLGLPLPGILLVDGISGAFGDKGFDPKRVTSIYKQILRVCDESRGQLQVVVADTRVPDIARKSVVLELSETERLAPSV